MEKKTYQFGTAIADLTAKLEEYLDKSGISYWETDSFDGWMFWVDCNEEEYEQVNDWIDKYFEKEFMMLIETRAMQGN